MSTPVPRPVPLCRTQRSASSVPSLTSAPPVPHRMPKVKVEVYQSPSKVANSCPELCPEDLLMLYSTAPYPYLAVL